jgi:hypothetical protein
MAAIIGNDIGMKLLEALGILAGQQRSGSSERLITMSNGNAAACSIAGKSQLPTVRPSSISSGRLRSTNSLDREALGPARGIPSCKRSRQVPSNLKPPVFLNQPGKPIKAARFMVSGELLHAVLLLPPDCEVRGMTWNHEIQAYEISVRGDALPDGCLVEPGFPIPQVLPRYKHDYETGTATFEGW